MQRRLGDYRRLERSRRTRLKGAIASAPGEVAALAVIRRELDPYLEAVTKVKDREDLYLSIRKFVAHAQMPRQRALLFDDLLGAISIFCVALAASVPAVLPLALIEHPWLALRVSNFLVVGLLFVVGYHRARYVDVNRWIAGVGLMGLGLALVVIAILLGG